MIAFGLWYWDPDRGSAAAREHHPQATPAFIFPEMLYSQYVPAPWVPKFAGYLSPGSWTATAFSPTDICDQTLGQAADDHRSGRVPWYRRARDRRAINILA